MDIITSIIVVGIFGAIFLSPYIFYLKKKYNNKINQLENINLRLQSEIKSFEKYKIIEEVEKHVDNIKNEAEKIKSEANDYAEFTIKRADEFIKSANKDADNIIDAAKLQANEIASKAWEAKANAEHYEATVIAMKNIINGYGDQYIKPTHSLLDDLAEEYSFKTAGEELKKARDNSKKLSKFQQAATCSYVEPHRKQTAINFVIDAFNGKVDSILSRVKHDNYGKLEQEIRDAFRLVNNNGKAFRDAVITPEYLDSRINELHWAVRVMIIREEERQEQKRIQDQIREEERARKEYEKAIKDAEKEEQLIQKALAEARSHLKSSSEAERLKYQAKLEELTEKLRIAEEKNQRAISMAQQTRMGHVYIISNIGSFGEHIYKIGMTRRLEPLDRVKELGDASVPFDFDIHALIACDDAPSLELSLQKLFDEKRVNKVNMRKEYFNVTITEIKNAVEAQNIEAKWTMRAEAYEYRESLALGLEPRVEILQ